MPAITVDASSVSLNVLFDISKSPYLFAGAANAVPGLFLKAFHPECFQVQHLSRPLRSMHVAGVPGAIDIMFALSRARAEATNPVRRRELLPWPPAPL